jgi:hypothetical protein
MNGPAVEGSWCLPESIPAVSENPHLEFIMDGWPIIAAVAWQGYRESGRGMVTLDEDRCVQYSPGSLCLCHQQLVDHYAPEHQVVVALQRGDLMSIHIVAGWPAPPDAYRITPAERLHLTAH